MGQNQGAELQHAMQPTHQARIITPSNAYRASLVKTHYILEDLSSLISENQVFGDYRIAIAEPTGDGNINFLEIEAFHWDDDEEFFLVPEGKAHHYKLVASELTANALRRALDNLDSQDVLQYEAYARSRVKSLPDASVASVNSPIWGSGVYEEYNYVYFCHGSSEEFDQPNQPLKERN